MDNLEKIFRGDLPVPDHITIIKAWRHGNTPANELQLLSGGGSDDNDGTRALNAKGKQQAEVLGEWMVNHGVLHAIYTSDLSRAIETAEAVRNAFGRQGLNIPIIPSLQLREILHGEFELGDVPPRNQAGYEQIAQLLKNDLTLDPEEVNQDPYRFWKIHPLVSEERIVPADFILVEDYINRGETRPETPYQLWNRITHEVKRIGEENLGKIVGLSMHGAGLSVLIEGLRPKGLYYPPHYLLTEFKHEDKIIVPAAKKVQNCEVVFFLYDSQSHQIAVVA